MRTSSLRRIRSKAKVHTVRGHVARAMDLGRTFVMFRSEGVCVVCLNRVQVVLI